MSETMQSFTKLHLLAKFLFRR